MPSTTRPACASRARSRSAPPAAGRAPLGLADRAAGLVVELDGQVGDAAGRDVGGDVDLAAADDAEVDDACGRRGRSPGRPASGRCPRARPSAAPSGFLSSIQPRNCQMARKSSMSLISGVPVSAISSGPHGARARIRSESSSTCCERCEVLFLMKCASSTTMPRKPKVAEPADVPVEHLVVDDDDVGEAVDRVAVAVDHGGRAVRRPEAGLAGPVGLDDVRHDDEQRVGVRRLRGEQRLRGLAQARLVGEQEGPVAGRARRPPAPGAASARRPPARAGSTGLGQRHARRAPPPARSNELKQRAEQLPAGQPARGAALCRADEKSGARKGLASCRRRPTAARPALGGSGGRRARRRRTSSSGRLDAGGASACPA
jgi:hypothetical protein